MKRNLRQSILYVLIVLILINSSCQPDDNYSPESDFQEDTIQSEPELQEQSVKMEPVVIFDNLNSNPHSEFPPIPPTFTLTDSWRITSILVNHWNHAQGVEPGEITILDDQGNIYGTWQSEGVAPDLSSLTRTGELSPIWSWGRGRISSMIVTPKPKLIIQNQVIWAWRASRASR